MQRQYPKKLRKLFNQFPFILPTEYQTFYSVFKLICSHLANQDVTPQIINQISKLYNTIKQLVQLEAQKTNKQIKQQGNLEVKTNFGSNQKPNEGNKQACLYNYLNHLLQPLLTYLPSTSASKLLYRHFLDPHFYSTVQLQRSKAEAIVDQIIGSNIMDESGVMSMKPPAIYSLKAGEKRRLLSRLVNQKGASCKLHINGSNQLAINFWVNCFKSDYAVHFDVFWAYFQHYLNSISSSNKSSPFYSIIFPYPCNLSTKSLVHGLIDPDYKYYITSANCNQLFIKLNQFEIIEQLIQLSLRKQSNSVDRKSQRCLSMKYGWTGDAKGTVSINNFGKPINQAQTNMSSLPIPNPPSSVMQLPSSNAFYLTGNSIALEAKISNSKYAPTIRFGSLNDNEISIKNKYVSRRQFMIIEQIIENQQKIQRSAQEDDTFTHDKFKRGQKIKQKQTKKNLSIYYLVCLSPTNHTCLVYPHRVEVQSGLIFKMNGIFIQVIRQLEVYKGMISKNEKNSGQEYKNGNEKGKNESADGLSLLQQINEKEDANVIAKQDENSDNFQLLTMIPICKTEENEQQKEYDKTLLQLPTNKSQMILDRQLQCMFISGSRKNIKFVVTSEDPTINLQFELEEGSTQRQVSNNNKSSIFRFEMENKKFCVPKKTEILAKRANQVLEGHFSDKVELEEGMKIVLEEIYFEIIQ